MFFYLKTAELASSLPDDRLQTAFDRHLGVGDAPADAADQMVVRILDGLEIGDGHPEIKLAQAALLNQHAQVAVDSAQAQSREAALDELVNLVRRQMAAVMFDGVIDRLPLFCVSSVH